MKATPLFLFAAFYFIFVETFGANHRTQHEQSFIKIRVKSSELRDDDTLFIQITAASYAGIADLPAKVRMATRQPDGSFTFKVPVNYSVGYFSISRSFSKSDKEKMVASAQSLASIMQDFLWEAGDDINIQLEKFEGIGRDLLFHKLKYHGFLSHEILNDPPGLRFVFSGKGVTKYQARIVCDSVRFFKDLEEIPNYKGTYPYWQSPDFYQKGAFAAIHKLETFRKLLSERAFQVLKADYTFEQSKNLFAGIASRIKTQIKLKEKDDSVIVGEAFKGVDNLMLRSGVPDYALCISNQFDKFVVERAKTWYQVTDTTRVKDVKNMKIKEEKILEYILSRYKGMVRDKLITFFILNYGDYGPANEKLYYSALKMVSTSVYRTEIMNAISLRGAGDVAFNFKLPDASNRFHELKDYWGKIVVLDFWFTGCGGCSKLYKKTLSPAEEILSSDSSVVFVSISVDGTKDYWVKNGLLSEQYAGSRSINLFTEGKGSEHKVIQKYNKTLMFPLLLLISKDGRIIKKYNTFALYAERENSIVTDVRALLKQGKLNIH